MMKCSFSRFEVGRSSSMLLPCTVDSPSCSLLVTWAVETGLRTGEAWVLALAGTPQGAGRHGYGTVPANHCTGSKRMGGWPLSLSLLDP